MVAATNRDLQKLVEEGKFREDLWYRLTVIRIKMPPLRERHGDIPLLAQLFVDRSNQRFGTSARLTESGLQALNEYTWPGNVRQMQHLIERSVHPGSECPHRRVCRARRDCLDGADDAFSGKRWRIPKPIRSGKVLAAAGGNKSRAAKILASSGKLYIANWSEWAFTRYSAYDNLS